MLLLGLIALSGSKAQASDGVSEAVVELLDNMVEAEPERAGVVARLLIDSYEGNADLRDENILRCLRKVQRCWEDVVSDATTRPLCVALARKCRALVQATPKRPVQIEAMTPTKSILYKTLDLCGASFDVSRLRDAVAADADLALALQYMGQKGVRFSSYCFVDFYAETGSKTLSFGPGRFERGVFLGSPSPDTPSYQVTIDDVTGQVTLGHYQK